MENNTQVEDTTSQVPGEQIDTDTNSSEDETNGGDNSQGESLDYRELYEKEKEKLSKAEFKLYQKSKAEKEARLSQRSTDGYIDPEEVQKVVEEKAMAILQEQRQREAEDVLEEELVKLSNDEDERRLIRLMYENRIQQTGYTRSAIREDLQTAYLIANAPKLQRATAEKIEALKAKATLSQGGTAVGTNQDRPILKEDLTKHFSEQEIKFMQGRGWSEAQMREAAESKKTGYLSKTIS
jgi:hypothetical protein